MRNHVAVIPTVGHVVPIARAITRAVPGTKGVFHTEGDGRPAAELETTARTLAGLGVNANVASVLVVGLGSERHGADEIAGRIREQGRTAEVVVVQQCGGSRGSIARGIELATRLVADAAKVQRREAPWASLTVAMECGGSDALSGITANPSIGCCSDWLVGQGGTVIFSEITEMIGTETILARRAASAETAMKIERVLDKQKQQAIRELGPLASGATISPGNIEGGLTSIQEKSLGCIAKGGTTAIVDVLDYAVRPERAGLHIMDTPGSDIFSITGMVAAGAQIVIFSTGRGSPAGFPLCPVIKISSNSGIYRELNDDIDIDAGRIVEGVRVAELGAELTALVEAVALGQPSKAEANGYDLLAIHAGAPAVSRTTAR